MIIKPSAMIRQNYNEVSDLCKKTQEPIYLTKNGEGDLVVMDIDAFEEMTERINLRERIIRRELEDLQGNTKYLEWDDCYNKLLECAKGEGNKGVANGK